MSTKVKGEAIKEGSIPLSALSDSLQAQINTQYGLTGYVGELSSSNTKIESSSYVLYIYNRGKIYDTLTNNAIYFNDGPAVTITINSYGFKTVLEITTGEDRVDYYGKIFVFDQHNKPPQETPNWNAQEGEPGYIENKPFRFIDAYGNDYQFTNPLKREDFEALPPNEFDEVLSYRKPIDATSLQYVVCNKDLSTNEIVYNTMLRSVNNNNGKYRIELGEYSGYIHIEEGDWDNGDSNNWLIVEMDYPDAFFPEDSVFVIDSSEDIVDYVGMSVNINIPNTVIKTTPQTLSDTDKNQALANLGIDPVVWKYLCNPIVVEIGKKAPVDILTEFKEDEDMYYLKHYASGMFKGVLVTLDDFDNGGSHVELLPAFYCNETGFNVYVNSAEISEAIGGRVDLGTYIIYVDSQGKWNYSFMD